MSVLRFCVIALLAALPTLACAAGSTTGSTGTLTPGLYTPTSSGPITVPVNTATTTTSTSTSSSGSTNSPTCPGKFPNPITDIGWAGIFPITLGNVPLMTLGQKDNNSNPSNPFCACGHPPKAGVVIAFWEPIRIAEAVRHPWCFPSLGGLQLNPGIKAPSYGANGAPHYKEIFYQAHWYTDPVLYWLQVLLDDSCLESGQFDLAYITEVDPLWNDDILTFIINPDVALYANPVAQAVCAADCVAATTGFGFSSLYWCAGCQGDLYPMDGNVTDTGSPVGNSVLIAERMIAKLHRELLLWAGAGQAGECGYYFQPVVDKTNYKLSMLYPIPQTGTSYGTSTSGSGSTSGSSSSLSGSVSSTGSGTGSSPTGSTPSSGGTPSSSGTTQSFNNGPTETFGESTMLWEAGRSFPYKGEDFAYMIWRKRNCCQSVVTPQTFGP